MALGDIAAKTKGENIFIFLELIFKPIKILFYASLIMIRKFSFSVPPAGEFHLKIGFTCIIPVGSDLSLFMNLNS